MSGVSPEAIVHAVHQIGAIVWIGSLFFVRLVLLPSTGALKRPMSRMRVRLQAYKRLFRWGWVGLLIVWGSGLWSLKIMEPAMLPTHVLMMAGMAAAMVLLHLVGFFAFYLNMAAAVEEDRLIRAAKNNYWMRKLIWINLLLGLAATVLGASGAYLFG
jgi:uncharacterized membrane protein